MEISMQAVTIHYCLQRFATTFALLLFITVASDAQTSWKGTTSTSWGTSSNWTNGVPNATTDAIIGDASFTSTRMPTIGSTAVCKSLTIGGTKTAYLTVSSSLTINGDLTINSGSTLKHGTVTLTIKGNWVNNGTYTATTASSYSMLSGTTYTYSTTVFAGANQAISGSAMSKFLKCTINAGTYVTLNTNITLGNILTLNGTLFPGEPVKLLSGSESISVGSTGVLKVSAATVAGNYGTNSIVLSSGSTVDYCATLTNQTVSSSYTYSTLKISGTGIKTLQGNLPSLSSGSTSRGNISVVSGTLDVSTYSANRGTSTTGGTLSVSNGAFLRIGGTNSLPANYATISLAVSSTVEYYGGVQTIRAATYGNLALSTTTAPGSKTAAGILNIAGNFNLATATFVAGSYTHTVGGNWSMASGAFTNTGNAITFNGTGTQTITSTGPFNNVTVNKASGTLSLGADITINTLAFAKGNITTGVYKVIIPQNGNVTGAGTTTGWVNGFLQKYFPTTATAGATFEIGGPLYYSPVTTAFASITTAGSLIASAKTGSHPSVGTSTIASNNISRYWSLSKPTSGGLVYSTATLTFSWNSADNYSPLTASSLVVANYTNAAWSYPAISGTSSTTSVRATGVISAGDFAVGELSPCTISSGFSYSAGNFCSNPGMATITLNAGSKAGTFSTTTSGLGLNPVTGEVNLGTSLAGNYTIKNTVVEGTCTSTSNATIQIAAPVTATIAYSGTTFCQSGGVVTPTITGTTGGSFSAPTALQINGVTGEIDLAASDAGTYTVTYLLPSQGPCGNFTTTTTITVTQANTAEISYPEIAYCSNGGIVPVELDGTTGGTFSSTTGLSIDKNTGAINLGSSSVGDYTVTYSSAANGCAAVSAITTISITASSPAAINYPASPYLTTAGTIPVTITGPVGGTFTSSINLAVDDTSGAIDLGRSVPGTYTVNYSLGGCNTATAVTVNVDPSTSINYNGGPFCSVAGSTAPVTITGTTGGTFSSTAGLSINSATGLIDLGASTGGTYIVTYSVTTSGAPYRVTTNVIIGGGIWTGGNSTAWNVAANWQCGILPGSTSNITIPAGLTNYPVISTSIAINNLTLGAGNGVGITVTNGTLQIGGTTTTNGGKITATSGKVEFTGTTAQTIPAGLFFSNAVKDLVISNPAGVALAGPLRVTNTVGFGKVNNSVLNSNGYLTLVSTLANTAALSDVTNGGVNTGNIVAGEVTVERYVQGRRLYRFLTAPVNTAGSIKANWMEGVNNATPFVNNNPVPDYGTHITGPGGANNGFDASQTNNPSLFSFNNLSQSWVAASSTNVSLLAGNPWRVLIRGSRNVDLNNNISPASLTTLRAKGTLVTGPVTMAKSTALGTPGMPLLSTVTNAYNLVGNPYASPVDWLQLQRTDISSTFYIYDPTISGSNGRGQYVSYNGFYKVANIANSAVNNDIQSGQAFFILTSGPNPSLTFRENHKLTGSRQVFRTAATALPNLSIQLLLPDSITGRPVDGARVFFSDEFSNTIGEEDFYKLTNLDENLAVVKGGVHLSIAGRKPVTAPDTIPLRLWQLSQTKYKLNLAFDQFPQNIQADLHDAFEHTTTPLNIAGETVVSLGITTDTAAMASNRFSVVFKLSSTLPVTMKGVKAYEKNKGVQIDWSAESENSIQSYEVERAGDAQQFTSISSVKAKNNTATTAAYSCFDADPYPGDNYYRIKTIDNGGNVKWSEVVRVQMASTANTISVINNPSRGGRVQLLFNNMEKGDYVIGIFTNTGARVYTGSISHPGGSITRQIELQHSLPAGAYHLQVGNRTRSKLLHLLVQ